MYTYIESQSYVRTFLVTTDSGSLRSLSSRGDMRPSMRASRLKPSIADKCTLCMRGMAPRYQYSLQGVSFSSTPSPPCDCGLVLSKSDSTAGSMRNTPEMSLCTCAEHNWDFNVQKHCSCVTDVRQQVLGHKRRLHS